jgi:hypothetical protein
MWGLELKELKKRKINIPFLPNDVNFATEE